MPKNTKPFSLPRQKRALLALEWAGRQHTLLLTNELLRELCGPVFRRVREVIGQAMKNRERGGKISEVVLVGGSAQMEVFASFLEELFGRRPAVMEWASARGSRAGRRTCRSW